MLTDEGLIPETAARRSQQNNVTMETKIEKGVPMPTVRGANMKRYRIPFAEMVEGDSWFVKYVAAEDGSFKTFMKFAKARTYTQAHKAGVRKFVSEVTGKGLRVWHDGKYVPRKNNHGGKRK